MGMETRRCFSRGGRGAAGARAGARGLCRGVGEGWGCRGGALGSAEFWGATLFCRGTGKLPPSLLGRGLELGRRSGCRVPGDPPAPSSRRAVGSAPPALPFGRGFRGCSGARCSVRASGSCPGGREGAGLGCVGAVAQLRAEVCSLRGARSSSLLWPPWGEVW